MEHFSGSIRPASSRLNFSPRWRKSKAMEIQLRAPIGAGTGRGTLLKSIVRRRARWACFKSPTARSLRHESFASANHAVLTEGPWHDPGSCWFNNLYARTVPSHAIEMTAAYLHQTVIDILADRRMAKASVAQKQKLATVVHLCGAKRGESFAARGFKVKAR